jgi:molybdenum cofactor biosynthesis protein B
MDPSHNRDIPVGVSVVTVSTTRDESTDKSGPVIRALLSAASLPVVRSAIVPDDIEEIRRELFASLEVANCVIFSGGTGLTGDDCTIEAIEPLLEKTMPGFGEIFRSLSVRDVGTRVLLSRALGGVTGQKAVFCIPGSVGASELAVRDLIIPELRHILTHASK